MQGGQVFSVKSKSFMGTIESLKTVSAKDLNLDLPDETLIDIVIYSDGGWDAVSSILDEKKFVVLLPCKGPSHV
jgi:hypothetical protein